MPSYRIYTVGSDGRFMYVVRTFRTFGLAIREYVAHLVWRFRLRLPADAGGVFVRWSFV